MEQANLTPQTKSLISRLYSSDEVSKKEAIYRILFDRRTDLLPELKKAVHFEKNEKIAIFMIQVSMTLSSFPRDASMERRILKILQNDEGSKINNLTPSMWKYLENCATSKMIIAILACMGDSVPPNSYEFIEVCLTHPDPDVRAMVCEKALYSGRPSHFAYVLNLVTDKDPIVSRTAFLAIKNMPPTEMSIILDYALGSPDEWVLNSIAPFLPNLINNSLRTIIAKVQYHSNPNIAKKAREALKTFDAIPRKSKYHKEEKKEETIDKIFPEEEKKISLKSQLEQKRKEQEDKERAIREANEELDKELASVDKADMDDFAKAISDFNDVFPMEENKNSSNKLEEDKIFAEDTDFSNETKAFSDIDDNSAEDLILELERNGIKAKETKAKIPQESEIEQKIPNEKNIKEEEKIESQKELNTEVELNQTNIVDTSDNIIDTANNDEQPKLEVFDNFDGEVSEYAMNSIEAENSHLDFESELEIINLSSDKEEENKTNENKENNIEELLEPVENNTKTDGNTETLDQDTLDLINMVSDNIDKTEYDQVDFSNMDFASVAETINSEQETINIDKEKPEFPQEKKEEEIKKEKILPQTKIEAESQIPKQVKTTIPQKSKVTSEAVVKVSIPANAKEIIEKYPSFITDTLLEVFKATTSESKLKAIDKVVTNLTAFLNLCFLQTAMFYAPTSSMLNKTIKDCIKGNLTGPSAIRCLHNFILAIKSARSNAFFTFPLSRIMDTTNESSPLLLIRELKDFLREPEEPLAENIPMAVDGLIEILKGVRAITTNTLVMRTPQGAKLPYADLSGPTAKALSEEKRPSIDLPAGEVVVLSSDFSEALGLYPFFKYQKKKIVYSVPTSEEIATLFERLEIEQ